MAAVAAKKVCPPFRNGELILNVNLATTGR